MENQTTPDQVKRCGDFGGRNADGSPCRRVVRADAICSQHAGANPGGRPPFTFTPEEVEQVEKLAAMLPMARIADFFGIHEDTLRNKFEKDPAVFQAYTRGRAKVEAAMAKSVIVAGTQGDLAAAQFYLRTQAGWSDKQKLEHEHSGPGGAPLALTVRFVRAEDGRPSGTE